MPISGTDIQGLIDFLNLNKIKLFHSCQLKDFKTYIELKGVPSRNILSNSGKAFTAFTSDKTDVAKNVWDKVFFNFSDMGEPFHKLKWRWTPNVYGPVLFIFSPMCFEKATDISISLCSVTDPDFNRENDSLSLEDVKKLFKGRYLKKISDIEELFPGKKVKNIEINCTFKEEVPNEVASLYHVDSILVDPIVMGDVNLYEIVKDIAHEYDHGLGEISVERVSTNQRIFDALIDLSQKKAFYEEAILSNTETCEIIEEEISGWLASVLKILKGFMLANYLNYLHAGTLQEMLKYAEEKKKSS